MNDSTNPYVRWRDQHPHRSVSAETNARIWQWQRVTSELLALFDLFDDEIEPWLKGRKLPEPNLVALIAGYGYTRIVTGNWTSLPIDIPESELQDWDDNSGLLVTIEQLRDYQAGVASYIPTMLHSREKEVLALIDTQLNRLYDELETLVAKPIDDFTPTQWPDEMIGEEDVDQEVKELDRIFDLYEQLWCFEHGIEELRMLMITEDNPEFHLPSEAFYNALKSIDSHKLVETLHRAEPKLKQVLRLWSQVTMSYTGKPYHRPYEPSAPAEFWWRHPANGRARR